MTADGPRPIIVIKKKGGHAGHHGGAWKVAYADFVTAMMSLFIVLWLLNSTPQVKKAIAGYFNDPSGTSKETGSSSLGSGEAVSIDKLNVEKLKEEIQKAILKQANLEKLSKQVEITVTGEGLKIELLEGQGGTFFQSGSPKLNDNGENLLTLLAAQVKDLPNRLLIEGHTDSQPYSGDNGYTNWELSSDRANSARRLLQQGGVRSQQISQVRGYADQSLRKPGDPLDPSNRRISLIVQWQTAPPAAPGDQPAAGAEKAAGEEKSTSEKPSSPEVKPAAPTGPKSATPAPAPAESATAAAAAAQPPPPPAAAPKPGVMARVKALLPAKKK